METAPLDAGPPPELHDPTRGLSRALEILRSAEPGSWVRCLRTSGLTSPPPPALRELLPGVHWVVEADHPLIHVDPSCHLRLTQSWFDAAQGPTRIGRSRLRTVHQFQAEDGEVAPVGWYDLLMVDLVGVEGMDAVVVVLAPSADLREGERELPPAWLYGTSSFRVRLTADATIESVTDNVVDLLGRPGDELIGRPALDLIHPDDHDAVIDGWNELVEARRLDPFRMRLMAPDEANVRWFEATSWNALDDPSAHAVIAELRDIDAQVRSELARAETLQTNKRLRRILDEIDDVVIVTRLGHGVVYANQAAYDHVVGLRVGRRLRDLMKEEPLRTLAEKLEPFIDARRRWTGDIDYVTRDGMSRTMATTMSPVTGEDDDHVYFGVIMRDVTAERAHARALSDQARTDPLTGLPNRLALMERLQTVRSPSADGRRRPDDLVGLCFIDVDNLKIINDGLGHGAGDQLLVALAEELRRHVGHDMVARFGGDEFVVLVEHASHDAVVEMANGLPDVIARVQVPGVTSHLTASVGVAVVRRGDIEPEAMLRDADAAMYQAKRRGRDQVLLFDEDMHEQATRRFVVETSLRQAISEGTIEVHLQPVVDLAEDRVRGYEALARWGLVRPLEFVTTAEESGLIVPLGQWVLEQALRSHAALRRAEPRVEGISIGVNVSGRQLLDPTYAERTLATIADFGLDPPDIILELTESVLIDPVDDVDRSLRRLRDAGVRLALDDFGSGYSSISYLRRYPIEILKLDLSYTQSLIVDPETRIIAEAIVTMARRLGMEVVAEGIETLEQLEAVRDLGIHSAQGFLFAAAQPVEAIVLQGIGAFEQGLAALRDRS